MDKRENCAVPDAETLEAAAETSAEMVFVSGDRGAGLVIIGLGDARHQFCHTGIDIDARLGSAMTGGGVLAQTLRLGMDRPTRFRIEWLIPDKAVNAAMTLNGGLLISPFAPGWPADGPQMPVPACGHQAPVSTLHPGRFQAIDFTWEGGDELVLYLVLQ